MKKVFAFLLCFVLASSFLVPSLSWADGVVKEEAPSTTPVVTLIPQVVVTTPAPFGPQPLTALAKDRATVLADATNYLATSQGASRVEAVNKDAGQVNSVQRQGRSFDKSSELSRLQSAQQQGRTFDKTPGSYGFFVEQRMGRAAKGDSPMSAIQQPGTAKANNTHRTSRVEAGEAVEKASNTANISIGQHQGQAADKSSPMNKVAFEQRQGREVEKANGPLSSTRKMGDAVDKSSDRHALQTLQQPGREANKPDAAVSVSQDKETSSEKVSNPVNSKQGQGREAVKDTENNELDEIPGFYNVYASHQVSPDFDGYLEAWYFEVDVDVPNSATESTDITIIDTQGNNYGTYGPFEFTGYLTSDNAFIGPFTDLFTFWEPLPADVAFVLTLSNGGDTFEITVPVDDNYEDADTVPYFYSVTVQNAVDDDVDGYNEAWDFVVDIDVYDGSTQTTNIRISDSNGTDYGWFGPFDFSGSLTSDNVYISFDAGDLGEAFTGPDDVFFYFELEADGDGYVRQVMVDEAPLVDPPYFWDVYTAFPTDADDDSWYESWWFEIDVDVPGQNYATTGIYITDSNGNDYGEFGPFEFFNGATDDNVFIGPFSSDLIGATGPPDEVVFNFELTNGGDTNTEVVPADAQEDDHQDMGFWSVSVINGVDSDENGFLESWDFEIDVDVSDGGTAETFIEVVDGVGNNYGIFGPFAFTGALTSDNALITGFTWEMLGDAELPAEVQFYFGLSNGGDQYSLPVPVDGEGQQDLPYFYNVYTAGPSDVDDDGYLEAWWFEVDADVDNGASAETTIEVYGPDGSLVGIYGPATFTGYLTSDNAFIGPFDATMFPGGPADMEFSFVLTNGGDTTFGTVPVDAEGDAHGPMSIYAVSTINGVDADENGFLESWDFEIDADVSDGGSAETWIAIWDDLGNDYGTYGPFTFTGFATDDNAFISGFTWGLVNPEGPPMDVNFTFMLTNGEASQDELVPVDGEGSADIPFFWSVYTTDVVDGDDDGWLESWYYTIDVDVPNGSSAETMVYIFDDNGAIDEVYGPFTFTGSLTEDNAVIGPFNSTEFIEFYDLPNEIPMNFELSNGGDLFTHYTPADGEGPILPQFYNVYDSGVVDTDEDTFAESWYFEIDVDVPGSMADTDIQITNNVGDDYGWFGTFTFEGYLTSDNVFIGPFTSDLVSIETAQEVMFTFTLSNGGDVYDLTMGVDDPTAGETPFFWSVNRQNEVDEDGDFYLEAWDFVIDVDVPNMGTASTRVHISDNVGNDYGWFGPFTFYNGATDDNVFIGTFTSDIVMAPDAPQDVEFTFELDNGGDVTTNLTPVDEPSVQEELPFFWGVYIDSPVDEDEDGYFEAFNLEIDVDVPNGATAETNILIVDAFGNDFGEYGPFTFVNGNTDDNIFIGPFTQEMWSDQDFPGWVDFQLTLTNGGDVAFPEVPVDGDGTGEEFPFFYDIYTVDVIDADEDGWFEAWYFEVDVDVPMGGTAETDIHISDSEGNDYGWYGPFTFVNGNTDDNVFFGLFSAELVAPEVAPGDVEFYFELSNGGDTETELVPVDEPNEGPTPAFWNTYIVDAQDFDEDGYYESWNFEVDVDVPDGGTAETLIRIEDGFGGDYGWFGPFTFTGTLTSDNALIGEFFSAWYAGFEGIPGNVNFMLTLSNGGDQMSIEVPVDGIDPTAPYFYDVYLNDPFDGDQDGYFEQWGFEIDVDVPEGATAEVEIHMTDNFGHDHGWFGPFTFTGYLTSDNAFIGPFFADQFNETGEPVEVEVGFQLDPGGDYISGMLPVDNEGAGLDMHVPIEGNVFELVSIGLVPESPWVGDVFSSLEDLAVVYNHDGNLYVPGVIDDIGNVDPGHAYRVLSDFDDMWDMMGAPADPATLYEMAPNTWNWLGYPFGHMESVEGMMFGMDEHLVIIMNDEGQFYIPNVINTLGVMRPGDGYMVFASDWIDFYYPQGGPVVASNTMELTRVETPTDAPARTGMPYAVLVKLEDSLWRSAPGMVELYSGSVLAGKAYIDPNSDITPVVTWQGSDAEGLEGFTPGAQITPVLISEDGSRINLRQTSQGATFGSGGYAVMTLEEAAIPTEFGMKAGYPNPFNPSINIPFALPNAGDVKVAVYNVLGREVFAKSTHFEAGYHNMVFSSHEAGFELVSGVYFFRMSFAGHTVTQKIVLMK
ncbi:T9SS type A sorting domain-containing protein [bacterium]|nr:T9SS type A sorting domain-containing protein [bacterium]